MSDRATPETDAEAEKLDFKVDLNFARKLERERRGAGGTKMLFNERFKRK